MSSGSVFGLADIARMRAQNDLSSLYDISNLGKWLETLPEQQLGLSATTIAAAFLNPCEEFPVSMEKKFIRGLVVVNWDSDRFAQTVKGGASKSTRHPQLEKFFERAKLGVIDKPATVVDKHGKILLWYLPNILRDDFVVSCA